MKLKWKLVSIVLLLSTTSFCQTADSALVLEVDSIVNYVKSIWYSDTDSAESIAIRLLDKCQEKEYKKGIAKGYNLLGVVNDIRGDYHSSLINYKKSAEIFLEISDSSGLAACHYNIALVLQNDEQFDQALNYVEKAYEYYYRMKMENSMAMSLMTMGNLYLTNNKGFEAAIEKIKQSEAISRKNGDTLFLCYALSLRGDANITQNKSMEEAISCFKSSVRLMKMKNRNNHWSLGFSNLGIAQAFYHLGNYDSALFYNDISLSHYEILNQKLGLRNTLDNRKDIFEKLGLYKEAMESYKLLKLYQDSIYNEQRSKQINRLKTEYDTERNEYEIASLSQKAQIQTLELEQKNQLILVSTIIGFLVLIAAYILYRQRILKTEREQTEIEQRFLRSQLNPHFIFNALSAIQNYMLKNDAVTASTYLTKFSKLMREILENSRSEFITVDEEIEMLRNYLDIHKMRLNNSFEYNIVIDEAIDVKEDTIPPMFVQPLLENAIEHGILNANGNGFIELKLTKDNSYINIEVRDNGAGLVEKQTDHKSLSSQITNERITLFNKSLKHKIQIFLEEITGDNGKVDGTRVELKVPFS